VSNPPTATQALQEAIEWLLELGADNTHENARRIERLAAATVTHDVDSRVLSDLDQMVNHIVARPLMYAESRSAAEDQILVLLLLRSSILKQEFKSILKFVSEKYPRPSSSARGRVTPEVERIPDADWTEHMRDLVNWMRG